MTSSYGEIVERLEKATQALIDAAERQARFWRDHQRRVRDRDEKTRFAVRAEPWENKALAARMALEALRQPVAFDYDAIPVPSDIAEFGARHNIEQFGNATYRNGFMEGQRALFVVFDLSCMWSRECIDHIEEPTEADLALGGWPR